METQIIFKQSILVFFASKFSFGWIDFFSETLGEILEMLGLSLSLGFFIGHLFAGEGVGASGGMVVSFDLLWRFFECSKWMFFGMSTKN